MTQTTSGVTIGHTAVFSDVNGDIKDGGPLNLSSGSVTSVSVTTHTGVSGTVTNPTTTPAISITLGAITPSSVAATGAVTGSNLSGTNTGDNTAPAQVLTGYVSGAGTVSASDSILTAIQKINGNTSLLTGAIIFAGTWNATTNSPALASGVGTKGTLYKVAVAGSTTIDGISQWNVGDSIVFDGTVWDKIDGIANEVISVQGLTGAVTVTDANLSTSDVTTNNVSITKHGFVPKAPNDVTKFLDGTGNFSTPSSGGVVPSSNVQGTTTNDNAPAGFIGEYVYAQLTSASGVSISTGNAANVVSISLTAGDWDVSANCGYLLSASTTVSNIYSSVNTTSGSLSAFPLANTDTMQDGPFPVNTPGGTINSKLGPVRFTLASTTTVYLVASPTFSGGTGVKAYGWLSARRVR